MGHSPLKYSQSTLDLSHIPEKDKWKSPHRKQGIIALNNAETSTNCSLHALDQTNQLTSELNTEKSLPNSISLPTNLQLCGCYMKDIERNTLDLSNIFNTLKTPQSQAANQKSPEKKGLDLSHYIKPRKEQLDKTLSKYKMHKSLPVSPVNEECRLADFANEEVVSKNENRHSFSYFVDLADDGENKNIREGFDQIFKDIEKLKNEAKYDVTDKKGNKKARNEEDEDGNFSSDSLEDCSFASTRHLKPKITAPPRRCVSNNEIYKYQFEEIDYSKYLSTYECRKSESFYLNPSNRNSQESILSEYEHEEDTVLKKSRSYCNSMESIISNESDCKSAPLEVLFMPYRQKYDSKTYGECSQSYTKSLPMRNTSTYETTEPYDSIRSSDMHIKRSQSLYEAPLSKKLNVYEDSELSDASKSTELLMTRSQSLYDAPRQQEVKIMKTSETQTDVNFEVPVLKKSNTSVDFQRKLLKFESCIAQNKYNPQPSKKSIAFFVDAELQAPKTPNLVKVKNNENSSSSKRPKNNSSMYIPTLESKNKQYRSKFCNVLNNKPELNIEIFESKGPSNNFTLTNLNFEKPSTKSSKNNTRLIESSSLDRHLLTKSLLGGEKITHKPPKAVRRHSSKVKKGKISYEYIKKDDYYSKNNETKAKNKANVKNDENFAPAETSIEFNYKEKNYERECTSGNFLNELYDSLDKPLAGKVEHDSLEVNLNLEESPRFYDSLEVDQRNLWKKHDTKKTCDYKLIKTEPQNYQKIINTDKQKYKELNETKEFNENKCKEFKEKCKEFTENKCLELKCKQLNESKDKSTSLSQKPNVPLSTTALSFDINKSFLSEFHNISQGIDKIHSAVENIKILNEIQRKINSINCLIDVYKQNSKVGKVKALSSMYETFLGPLKQDNVRKVRRRNLSLPNFVERRLNFEKTEEKPTSLHSSRRDYAPTRKIDGTTSGKCEKFKENKAVLKIGDYLMSHEKFSCFIFWMWTFYVQLLILFGVHIILKTLCQIVMKYTGYFKLYLNIY